VGNLVQQSDSLHKLLEMECSVVDPIKDVQMFISKNSTFADNDRLRNLYKQLGVYKPLGQTTDEGGAHTVGDPKSIISAGLLVDKTSRSMAQQLKQMEENRKKKVIEEEHQRREQAKMKKDQVLVDKLKGTRELLYRLGNKAMSGTLDRWLARSQAKGLESQASSLVEEGNGFRITSQEALDQVLYLLLAVAKPVFPEALAIIKQKLGVSDTSFLDPLI